MVLVSCGSHEIQTARKEIKNKDKKLTSQAQKLTNFLTFSGQKIAKKKQRRYVRFLQFSNVKSEESLVFFTVDKNLFLSGLRYTSTQALLVLTVTLFLNFTV